VKGKGVRVRGEWEKGRNRKEKGRRRIVDKGWGGSKLRRCILPNSPLNYNLHSNYNNHKDPKFALTCFCKDYRIE